MGSGHLPDRLERIAAQLQRGLIWKNRFLAEHSDEVEIEPIAIAGLIDKWQAVIRKPQTRQVITCRELGELRKPGMTRQGTWLREELTPWVDIGRGRFGVSGLRRGPAAC